MRRSKRPRLWLVALTVAGVAAAGTAVALQEDPSLEDQARQLLELDPLVPEGFLLENWTSSGTWVRARFGGKAAPASFTLRLWGSESEARRWFADAVSSSAALEPVQEMNTVEGEEHCVRLDGGTRCVGFEGNRSFVGATTGLDNFETELDALLLMRTARKHWHRVFANMAVASRPRRPGRLVHEANATSVRPSS